MTKCFYLLFVASLCLSSKCNNVTNSITENIYYNRDTVNNYFADVTILQRENNYVLKIFSDSGYIQYAFHQSSNGNYERTGNTVIATALNNDYLIDTSSNFITDSNDIDEFFLKRIKLMNELKINGVNSDFKKFGVNLKLYLSSSEVMLYVADLSRVQNSQWKSYINSAKLIGHDWYVSEN